MFVNIADRIKTSYKLQCKRALSVVNFDHTFDVKSIKIIFMIKTGISCLFSILQITSLIKEHNFSGIIVRWHPIEIAISVMESMEPACNEQRFDHKASPTVLKIIKLASLPVMLRFQSS